jgi:primosomal protein N' (replication factor Y)
MFARLAVNVPAVSGLFDYSIPASHARLIGIGSLVTAPFGKQIVQGVVLQLLEKPSVAETKELLEVLDPQPVLTAAQIALAEEMAGMTLMPLPAIITMMLPPGLSQQVDVLYQTVEGGRKTGSDGQKASDHGQIARRLLDLLQTRGPLRGRQIDSHFKRVEWRKTAQFLVRQGVLSSRSILPPPRVRPKFIRLAQLAVKPEEAEAAMSTLGTRQTLARRQAALRFLIHKLEAVNVSWVYAESGCRMADLQVLEQDGMIRLFENEIFRDPLARTAEELSGIPVENVELTPEQGSALAEIRRALASPTAQRPFLLQGVTGSGKTEIYIRAIAEVVRGGRGAILLVPEIALTPQTVRRILARFPGQVGLVHSKLSEGERYDTWRRARLGLLKVVIGPRSALFTPLPDIGLIVLDECHDSSYYQSEPPFYHAVTAAQSYARLAGAVCLLGSATPSMTQRYQAEAGEYIRLELPRRIPRLDLPGSIPGLPSVSIVDLREELKAGERSMFSRELKAGLHETLEKGEQAILFLNRRGTATYIFCRECGYALKCPQCETPLTLHLEGRERLLCHHCGYERGRPATCPACGGKQIREYGLGSEKVEAEVNASFPKARTLRWDWETTRQKDAHEMILNHFAAHRADVLIGTQMLAKGLDLPLVTLVGIVLADVGLNLPDPFAAERVFQTLTQVAGRAGRSARGGRVVLQTFMPEHYAIQAAARHDVEGFYRRELEYRKQLGYPPFANLLRLEYRHADASEAEAEARGVLKKVQERMKAGSRTQTTATAVPCFFSKLGGQYRWQIILRGPEPASLLRGLGLKDWRIEAEPASLL